MKIYHPLGPCKGEAKEDNFVYIVGGLMSTSSCIFFFFFLISFDRTPSSETLQGVLGSGENGVQNYREQGEWAQKDQGAGSKGK